MNEKDIPLLTASARDYIDSREAIRSYELVSLTTQESTIGNYCDEHKLNAESKLVRAAIDADCEAVTDVKDIIVPIDTHVSVWFMRGTGIRVKDKYGH